MPAAQSTATEQRAAEIAREHFGIDGDVVRMGGADSLNFRCSDRENGQWVLKLTEIDNRDVIGLQQSALSWLNARLPDIVFPEPRSPSSGELPVVDFLGEQRLAWMLRHRPGRVLVECQDEIDDPGTQLGTIVGRVDRALSGFSDDRACRTIRWDLAQCDALRDGLSSIEEPGQQLIATEVLTCCLEELATLTPSLRRSVIHGDANDHNLLASDGVITTVIDFGDVVKSWRVSDPAIAAAYHLMDRPDPLSAALEVLAAYHKEWALNEHEIAAFLPLVEIRLCMTVIHSAQADEDPYKHVHTEPAWRALSTLHRRNRREGLFRSRAACGLIANPELNSLTRALKRAEVSPVLPADIVDDCVLLDLSVQNESLPGVAGSAEKLGEWLFGEIKKGGARCGVGRYFENRDVYRSELFSDNNESRTLHLGVDLFAGSGTPVLSPLPGRIHSFADNDGDLDYGPTVIVEHELAGRPFFSLYGHLSPESLEALTPGQSVGRGETIGWIGTRERNGNWPPHVHFQLISDMLGCEGDFPGVARLSDAWYWRGVCPNPNAILRLDMDVDAAHDDSRGTLAERRARLLCNSLSLSYSEPLLIERGRGQHLYDHRNRAYLDLVNNVCHVGHCHPRVVAAITEQIRQLNTNTRYLHPLVLSLAERLTALFPDPLNVCYLVSSGSEANELALRLARSATGHRDFVVLDHAYHGNTTSLIDISPYKFDGPGGAGKPAHVEVVRLPDAFSGYGHGDELAAALNVINAMSEQGRPPAALFAETIPGCGGQRVLPDDFLPSLYASVRAAGGLCVADEVQTGMGRMGDCWWAFETQGLAPDIVTIGKPIGNGHPLAAVVTSSEIAERFDSGMEYFNTFGGNPVSSAAGLAVIDVIEDEDLRGNARRVGALFENGLKELAADYACIADVRGRGLFLGVEIAGGSPKQSAALTKAIVEDMLELGILLSIDGPQHNVLKIKPPMVVDAYDVGFFQSALRQVLTRRIQ